jgi:hypothetical protein
MKPAWPLVALLLLLPAIAPEWARAGRFSHCEAVEPYEPGKGVYKLWTARIKTEWEQRHHCLPGGRKAPYKVKVITYRERYSDGVQRTWKCVVAGSETPLGPPVK